MSPKWLQTNALSRGGSQSSSSNPTLIAAFNHYSGQHTLVISTNSEY